MEEGKDLKRLLKFSQIALVILLVTMLIGPAASSVKAEQPKAQPQLVQLAAQQPEQQVAVIVQKAGTGTAAEELVACLGGKVTQDLHIINGFAADLSAQDALMLARQDDIRWVSLDAPIVRSGGPDGTVNTTALLNVYNKVVRADKVWAQGYQGSTVTVAVVDSGWVNKDDFRATPSGGNMRLITRVGFNGNETNLDDHYGHGVHVAGVIGGNGAKSSGKYIGIAPKVNLISVKVSDGEGQGTTAGIVNALQWINDNRTAYNIRVVNISLNSTVQESYNTSPLDAAAEILWFNGIVVVVSAGNNGTTNNGILFPPANDPFVITVGATDDKGTVSISDDAMASFSSYGTTMDGFAKPDLVTPGKNIIAPTASGGAYLPSTYSSNKVDGKNDYFRMSGTSMSAPMVSGAVALLLQDEPNLTPDQVKYRLMATANKSWAGYTATKAGAGYLDIYAAVTGTTTQSSNTGLMASSLLTTGSEPVNSSVSWNSVSWNSVSWNSVSWNSVSWNSVSWNSVSWNSDYWGK